MQKQIFLGLVIGLTLNLLSCGTSNVNGTSSGADDAGFDPTKSSSLQVLHFDSIKESLLVNFDLTSGSQAVTMLNSKQAIFDLALRDYTSLFATNITLIMAKACEEMPTEAMFEDGPVIDTAWEKLTGRDAGEESAKLQADVLAKVSTQPDDVKIFALCMAVALSPEAMFINFVSGN